MTNKKNKLFTFIVSLVPGAGEMYLGFYKMGGSIMVLFWGGIALSGSLFPPLFYLLPILWFYSFFHTHNLNSMPDEEFYALEDGCLFPLKPEELTLFLRRHHKVVACILIIIGISSLWDSFWSMVIDVSEELGWTGRLFSVICYWRSALPQFASALFILWLGVKLFYNKKESLSTPPYLPDSQLKEENEKKSGSVSS